MKRLILSIICATGTLVSFSQRPAPDQIETSTGILAIQPILHGSLALSWNNKTICVDPYGGSAAFQGIAAPDLILITDIHGDHLNPETLNALETSGTVIVAPQAVADQLPENLKSKTVVLGNGKETTQMGVRIKAIPMYNLPEASDSRHTKGRGNGYVLLLGGKSIYISGDTEDIPEMRSLKDIDVAFICMNEPYTMDINQAAGAVLEFKPKIVYPYHYRGQNGLSDVESFKKSVNSGSTAIDVRLRNWYPGN